MKRDRLFHRRRTGAFWLVCIGVLTLLLWLDERYFHHLSAWRLGCWNRFQQLQTVVSTPVRYLEGWVAALCGQHGLYLRYQQLVKEHQYLVAQSRQLDELRQENRAMVGLLRLTHGDTPEHGWLAASLVNIPQTQFGYRFMINKGRDHQVKEGQTVVAEDGVVGKIDVVTQHTSMVLPIISPDNVMPVKNLRTERNCFCVGVGPDRLELLNIPSSTDMQIGDQLVTSDLGGGWLSGYPVGTVQRVDGANNQAFLTIEVKPAVDCWQLRSVLLLQSDDHQ